MFKEIVLLVPEEFTNEQVEFIKKSAMMQIETEMKKELKIPQADIDEVETKISLIKEAMQIEEIKPIEPEPIPSVIEEK